MYLQSHGVKYSLLQSVKRVIGVEIIENAVEDAKANAQLNGELYFTGVNHDSLTCFMVLFCFVSKGRICLKNIFYIAGVTNAQFVCGKAEDIIVDVFKNMPRKTKIIGIMDPPRAGLRKYMYRQQENKTFLLFSPY